MKILYVDDEENTLRAFAANHARDGVSVEICGDARQVVELLVQRKAKDLPDLIVMDLYTTKSERGTIDADVVNKQVDDLVLKITQVRDELGELVKAKKSPVAIQTLRDVQNTPRLRDIPVIISTREGMTLLGDELFRESVSLGATWMLKGREAASEREIFTRTVQQSLEGRRRLKRDVLLMLAGVALGAILSQIIKAFGLL
ncbi:MAG: response regulator [Hyphomonas sp.]